ncbi:hypothetical protein GA0115253_105966, partial [Streptomyces sp. Termitarium-T10T-6]
MQHRQRQPPVRYPSTTRRTSSWLPNPHRACCGPSAQDGGSAGAPVSAVHPWSTRAGVPTTTQQRSGPPSIRTSQTPGRSCPEPAPSSPSRSTTRPDQLLSWNARCVPASDTTTCTGIVRYSGSSPGPKRPPGSVFHSRYTPSRNRGPPARPPSPKNRASAGTSERCTHRTGPSPSGSHQRGGSSRRNSTPPGVRSSTAPVRDTSTVSRSATTCQPPSLPGSSTARSSGAGASPATAYDGSGLRPSHARTPHR